MKESLGLKELQKLSGHEHVDSLSASRMSDTEAVELIVRHCVVCKSFHQAFDDGYSEGTYDGYWEGAQ